MLINTTYYNAWNVKIFATLFVCVCVLLLLLFSFWLRIIYLHTDRISVNTCSIYDFLVLQSKKIAIVTFVYSCSFTFQCAFDSYHKNRYAIWKFHSCLMLVCLVCRTFVYLFLFHYLSLDIYLINLLHFRVRLCYSLNLNIINCI